jgi:hypothetical protein
MPAALSAAALGPPPPEVAAAAALVPQVVIEREELMDTRRLLVAKVGGTSCEAILDRASGDERLKRARCTCSFFHKSRLRAGPCRHLIALRLWSRT